MCIFYTKSSFSAIFNQFLPVLPLFQCSPIFCYICYKILRKIVMKKDVSRNPLDTGRKLSVHKTLKRCLGRLLNVFCTFNLSPVSRERWVTQSVLSSTSFTWSILKCIDPFVNVEVLTFDEGPIASMNSIKIPIKTLSNKEKPLLEKYILVILSRIHTEYFITRLEKCV